MSTARSFRLPERAATGKRWAKSMSFETLLLSQSPTDAGVGGVRGASTRLYRSSNLCMKETLTMCNCLCTWSRSSPK